MTTLTVYDPAMCCSTGICGPEVDPKLAQFSGDLDWLKNHGIEVKRINLSQEPALFAQNENVKSVLEKTGVEGLPIIIVNDALLSSGQYPARDELAQMTGILADTDTEEFSTRPSQSTEQEKTHSKSKTCCGGRKSKSGKSSSEGKCCGGGGGAHKKKSSCC